jgi:hypothetical protein
VSTRLGARALWAVPAQTAPWLVWLLAGAAGALAWGALGARAHAMGVEPICLLRRVAHIACPTCGMTRALALLANGEWRSALLLHPWAPMLAAQIVAGWALWGVALARGGGWHGGGWREGGPRPDRWIPHAVALNAAALILLWLVRLVSGTLPPA